MIKNSHAGATDEPDHPLSLSHGTHCTLEERMSITVGKCNAKVVVPLG